MTSAVSPPIPDIVIARLPIYLRALVYMDNEGKLTTSSYELGERLGISSAQIRKDLSHFGEFGKQGTGYHISYLVDQLRKILKLDTQWRVAVIGAGFLGHALANYKGFEHRGFQISWVFDSDPEKIGDKMNGLAILSIDEMEAMIKKEQIQIAIIAVPPEVAQEITNLAVAAGIKAILNYAPINLVVPSGVQIGHSDPVTQLQHMTYYLDKNIS